MPKAESIPLITTLKRNSLDDGPGIRTTVFFKGCPLSCVWCQNPEALSASQEIVYESKNCTGCSRCMQACGNQAVCLRPDGAYPIDKQKCRLYKGGPPCGQCVGACGEQALRFSGTAYEADELVKKILIDAAFFKNSNGGVTFSGGEPGLYIEYLSVLAQKLKENGIHLCIQTCGLFDDERFEKKLLPYLDLIFFDIKIFDREAHKKYCGVYNDAILRNFETLFNKRKVEILPRIPLVPGITTDKNNLTAIRDFFNKCGVKKIGLLPYNPLWLSKLFSIGVNSGYNHAEWMKNDEKDEIKEVFKDFEFRDF